MVAPEESTGTRVLVLGYCTQGTRVLVLGYCTQGTRVLMKRGGRPLCRRAAAGTSVEKDKAGGANPGVGKPAAGVGVRDSDRAIVDDLLEEM